MLLTTLETSGKHILEHGSAKLSEAVGHKYVLFIFLSFAFTNLTSFLHRYGKDAGTATLQLGQSATNVGVVYIDEGESSLIQVTVPESGVAEGLTVGAPVSLPGLVARPWQSVLNGRERHGIAYRATAVTPGAFPLAEAG